ncbi:RNA polymerase sigma-70 factor [Pedobacter frigoris]|uniref:RNA polymerase sigma factor n=1 Tax=Pedobacter frigoris TaxID=2571272 RepID=UPI002931BC20|nr:RNA polymerase sigma-70 factor [Pedobacter frigoris]
MESNVVNALAEEHLLLQDAALGSRSAFTSLYTFYLPKLYKYIFPFVRCSKEDTEEILHDMFMKIWEKKEDLSTIKSFNSYLYTMARNRLVNIHEHSKVKQKAIDYILHHSEVTGNNTDDNFIYSQYREVIQRAIDTLPPKRKRVFEMSAYEELSQDEIAVIMNISKSMVKKQLYTATRYVKEYLKVHADLTAFIALCFSIGLLK